jgi:hypothetical protein
VEFLWVFYIHAYQAITPPLLLCNKIGLNFIQSPELDIGHLTSATTSCIIISMTTTTNNKKQRVTLFLNPKLLIHARAQAVVENITLTKLVEKALIAYLPKQIVIKKPEL